MEIKAEFKTRKSMAKEITFLRLLLCLLVVPIFYLVIKILQAKATTIEFYSDKIISRSGLISKKERKSAFYGVYSVEYNQSIMGRIFNYGDVKVDVSGKWDINTTGVKDPKALAEYLETRTVKKDNFTQVVHN